MGLFDRFKTPKWKHKDKEIRKNAVSELTDEEILYDIALHDEEIEVRWAAIENPYLKKKDYLLKIAEESYPNYVAIRKIRKLYPDLIIKVEDVSKITDDNELLTLINTSLDEHVREEATLNITNEQILLNIINSKEYESNIKYAAIKNPILTDQSILLDIIKNHPSKFIRRDAADKINNNDLLYEIANNLDYDIDVRDYIKEKLNKQEFDSIKQKFYNGSADNRISTIIKYGHDSKYQPILEDIALNESNIEVRREAVLYLSKSNKPVHKKICLTDSDEDIRRIAKEKYLDLTFS